MKKSILIALLLVIAGLCMDSCRQEPDFRIKNSRTIGIEVESGALTRAADPSSGDVLLSIPFEGEDESAPLVLTATISDMDEPPVTKGVPITTANIGLTSGYNTFKTKVYKGTSTYTDGESKSMADVIVTYDATTDPSNPEWVLGGGTYYWPEDGSDITFCSYAPATCNGNRSTISWDTGTYSAAFSYALPVPATGSTYDDAAKQQDLLFAMDTWNKSSNGGDAKIYFYHALTAVRFTRGTELNDCKITKVVLENFYSEGDAIFYKEPAPSTDPHFVWSNQAGLKTYTQSFDFSITSSVPRAGTGTAGGSLDPTEWDTDVTNNGEYTFMMIPQQLAESAKIIIYVEGRIHPIELAIGKAGLDAEVGGTGNAGRLQDWTKYAGKVITLRVESEKMDMVRVAVDDKATGQVKSDIQTSNTGRNGVFMRVALLANGINKDDKIVKPIYIEDISSDSRFTLPTGWSTYWEYCAEDGFYYYKYVLPSGKKTCVDLFTTFTLPSGTISTGSEASDVKKVQFDVVIQGIDAGPGTTAAPYTKDNLEKAAGYFWPASIVGDISLEGKGI